MAGDLIHHPFQLPHPEWSPIYDWNPVMGAKTRRGFLESVAETDILVMTQHFPAPSSGHVFSPGQRLWHALPRLRHGARLMPILKIARMGHPVLQRRAEEVADPTAPGVARLVSDMIATMHDANGRGPCGPAGPRAPAGGGVHHA